MISYFIDIDFTPTYRADYQMDDQSINQYYMK